MSTSKAVPLVSVVIPTYRRPAAVRQAALSALAQTWPEVEVVVVSDGPDPATRASLSDLAPGLRYLELSHNQGPAATRNHGAKASHGTWLVFLDDDDTMLPERIERQMALADEAQPLTMVACRMWYHYGHRRDLWPRLPIVAGQDVGDYLLVRPSLMGRPGVISIQSLLLHRSVVDTVPFTSHADHEDWAWLLDAWYQHGIRVVFLWEPLVIYNIDVSSTSRSRRLNWEDSLEWAEQYQPWISQRAFCSFVATKVALKAKRAGDWRGLWITLQALLRSRPRLLELAFFTGIALLPSSLLQGAWQRSLRAAKEGGPQDRVGETLPCGCEGTAAQV